MNNEQIKIRADILIEIVNVINNCNSLTEVKRKINKIAIEAINNVELSNDDFFTIMMNQVNE